MRTLLACASLTLFLAACGFKGPLYLPAPAAKPAAAAPAAKPAVKADASSPRAAVESASPASPASR
ncbi:hypothetical protein B0T39_17015 [Chromobacterium haemolyticum]|nr:hypothetical protein B0T39_17015 [Chromobacterium haemolyticum]